MYSSLQSITICRAIARVMNLRSARFQFTFSSFEVNIGVRTDDTRLENILQPASAAALGWQLKNVTNAKVHFCFDLKKQKGHRINIYRNGELEVVNLNVDDAVERFVSLLRITVAEFAPNHAFIHSGAVAWNGHGIIFPARSFSGKSALTAALVRRGARYYSDEYAVLDRRGHLRPFPKDLSLRGITDPLNQVERSVESLGGKTGKRPIPVRLIVATEFKKRARWEPIMLSSGAAALEILKNSVSIRQNPVFVLSAVNSAVRNSLAVKSKRGDADLTAESILGLLDSI